MNKLITLTLVLLSVVACSTQPVKIKQYYRLIPNYEMPTNSDSSVASSVLITRPKGLSILAGRPMVATKNDGALVQLNNHYWLESPTILLHHSLKTWAEQHWQHIYTSAAFNERHQRLDSQILAFEKDGKQAKVSLHFVLTDVNGRVLLDQTFEQNLTIHGDGYADFVKTINLAVGHILNDLNQALTTL